MAPRRNKKDAIGVYLTLSMGYLGTAVFGAELYACGLSRLPRLGLRRRTPCTKKSLAADAAQGLGDQPLGALQGQSAGPGSALRPHQTPQILLSACTPRSRRWP